MHSNFITPPDFIETVLIRNASEEQVKALAQLLQNADKPYNIYFYNDAVPNEEWLVRVTTVVDAVLYADKKDPLEYFQ